MTLWKWKLLQAAMIAAGWPTMFGLMHLTVGKPFGPSEFEAGAIVAVTGLHLIGAAHAAARQYLPGDRE